MSSSTRNVHKRARVEETTSFSACDDTTIVLNMGGTLVTTLKSTLCAQPSHFVEWVRTDFKGFPKDEEGHPFIDRDAVNFKNILNYMRGYGLPTKSADLVLLAEDAAFYELESLRQEIGMDQPPVWRFNPGPGVSANGMELSTTNILGVCGSEPLTLGESHSRLFRMDRCERVAIGLFGLAEGESIHTDQQLYDQKMSVSYCNTGELIQYWYSDKMFTSGPVFKAQDIIEIRVDFPDEADGPTTSRALFAPYMTANGAVPFATTPAATATLPPPAPIAPIATATPALALGEETPFAPAPPPRPLPPPPTQAPGSPSLAAAPNPAASVVDGDPAPPVYVGPSRSLSHAYSSFTQGSNNNNNSNSAPRVANFESADGENVLIGAVVTIIKAGKVEFVIHWPQPVPPLHYAVSMQGSSSVTIVEPGADAVPVASPGVTATAGPAVFPGNPPNRPPEREGQPVGMTLPPPVPQFRAPPSGSARRPPLNG